jgi:hypothetical protein
MEKFLGEVKEERDRLLIQKRYLQSELSALKEEKTTVEKKSRQKKKE